MELCSVTNKNACSLALYGTVGEIWVKAPTLAIPLNMSSWYDIPVFGTVEAKLRVPATSHSAKKVAKCTMVLQRPYTYTRDPWPRDGGNYHQTVHVTTGDHPDDPCIEQVIQVLQDTITTAEYEQTISYAVIDATVEHKKKISYAVIDAGTNRVYPTQLPCRVTQTTVMCVAAINAENGCLMVFQTRIREACWIGIKKYEEPLVTPLRTYSYAPTGTLSLLIIPELHDASGAQIQPRLLFKEKLGTGAFSTYTLGCLAVRTLEYEFLNMVNGNEDVHAGLTVSSNPLSGVSKKVYPVKFTDWDAWTENFFLEKKDRPLPSKEAWIGVYMARTMVFNAHPERVFVHRLPCSTPTRRDLETPGGSSAGAEDGAFDGSGDEDETRGKA